MDGRLNWIGNGLTFLINDPRSWEEVTVPNTPRITVSSLLLPPPREFVETLIISSSIWIYDPYGNLSRIFVVDVLNVTADPTLFIVVFNLPLSKSNNSTPLIPRFSLPFADIPSFADKPCFRIYPFACTMSDVDSNVNVLTPTLVLTINDPWLTFTELFNWNLFPATSPWGSVVVTEAIPVEDMKTSLEIFDDGLPTNPYCPAIGKTSPELFATDTCLLSTADRILKYPSEVTPIPVVCITKSDDIPILDAVNPAPAAPPSK